MRNSRRVRARPVGVGTAASALALALAVTATAAAQAPDRALGPPIAPAGVRVLSTYRAPGDAEHSTSHVVRIAGVDPTLGQAILVTSEMTLGAREGWLEEWVEVVRLTRRARAVLSYRVSEHMPPGSAAFLTLGRYTGRLDDDLEVLVRMSRDYGVRYWGDEPVVVSSTGRHVVYGIDSPVLADARGRTVRPLLPQVADQLDVGEHVTFSPDGRLVAFSCKRYGDDFEGVCIASVDGPGLTRVALPHPTPAAWVDGDTFYLTTHPRTRSSRGNELESCLVRVEVGPLPTATVLRCMGDALELQRTVHLDPSRRTGVVWSRGRGGPDAVRVHAFRTSDGAPVSDAWLPRYTHGVELLDGPRLVAETEGVDPRRFVLDVPSGRAVELAPTISGLHRAVVGGREVVLAIRRASPTEWQIVELDLDPMFPAR